MQTPLIVSPQTDGGSEVPSITMSDYGFPVFHCTRPVTAEDVKSLDDEEF